METLSLVLAICVLAGVGFFFLSKMTKDKPRKPTPPRVGPAPERPKPPYEQEP